MIESVSNSSRLPSASSLTSRAAAGRSRERLHAQDLSDVEVEIIATFVRLANMLGLPRSYGEIYGLLFSHPHPLPLDGVIGRLGISAGSASQGIRVLRAMGLVNVVYRSGDRRDHYTAETRLRNLIDGVLRERLSPHLQSGAEQVSHLDGLVGEMHPSSVREHYKERVRVMGSWVRQFRRIASILVRSSSGESRRAA